MERKRMREQLPWLPFQASARRNTRQLEPVTHSSTNVAHPSFCITPSIPMPLHARGINFHLRFLLWSLLKFLKKWMDSFRCIVYQMIMIDHINQQCHKGAALLCYVGGHWWRRVVAQEILNHHKACMRFRQAGFLLVWSCCTTLRVQCCFTVSAHCETHTRLFSLLLSSLVLFSISPPSFSLSLSFCLYCKN